MTASDWLTLVNVILTALYVILMLSLVVITRRSLTLAREQVEEAKIQSQKNREESARQSQAALEASAKQSQECAGYWGYPFEKEEKPSKLSAFFSSPP